MNTYRRWASTGWTSTTVNLACPERSRRDPQIGRFLGVDPLAEETDMMSPYTAMNNDPVLNVDPLGLQATTMERDGALDNMQANPMEVHMMSFSEGFRKSMGTSGAISFDWGEASSSKTYESFWNSIAVLWEKATGNVTLTSTGDGNFISNDLKVIQEKQGSGLLADGGAGAIGLAAYVSTGATVTVSATAVVTTAGVALVVVGAAAAIYVGGNLLASGVGSGLEGYEYSGVPTAVKQFEAASREFAQQLAAEHTKNARPSTKAKHQKGQTRKLQDRDGNKGMQKYPRKRPKDWVGKWPPK